MSKRNVKTVRLPVTVVTNKGEIAPGNPVALDADEADALVKQFGTLPENPGEVSPVKRPSGKALENAMTAAIEQLDAENEDHFTSSGKPVVAELEKRLGFEISAHERDKFWEMLKPSGSSGAPPSPPAQNQLIGS